MKILLDTTERGIIYINDQKFVKDTDQILFCLQDYLKKNKASFEDIEKIGIVTGAGSFTSLRLAAVLANTLGYVKDIPLYQFKEGERINWDKKPVKMIDPDYGKKPNITKAKKK